MANYKAKSNGLVNMNYSFIKDETYESGKTIQDCTFYTGLFKNSKGQTVKRSILVLNTNASLSLNIA